MKTQFKYGRKARRFNPRIPHYSALVSRRGILAPPPAEADWIAGAPADWGMMLNDTLGDCTCAAIFHAIQAWSFASGRGLDTEPDADVLTLYEQACGYDPANPLTDQGGVEQDVLTYWMNVGAPLGNGINRNRIAGFVELDKRNLDDVRRAVAECGVVYIGFDVPAALMAQGDPPDVWDVTPNTGTEGGHAVVIVGYNQVGPIVISWGRRYQMTWAFFSAYTDETYALADEVWMANTGMTPCGLTLEQVEAQMAAMRGD